MTKKEIMEKVESIPEDILEAAYVFDVIQADYIQMHFNSDLLKKYHPGITNFALDDNGFVNFNIADVAVSIKMT